MEDYFEAWEKQGAEWKRILDSIRPEFDYAAAKHGMRVLPRRWDEPSLTLRWSSGGYERNLRAVLRGDGDSFELAFDGSIWRDVLQGNERTRQYQYASEVEKVYIGNPADVEKALPTLRDKLEKVRHHIDSLREHKDEVPLKR